MRTRDVGEVCPGVEVSSSLGRSWFAVIAGGLVYGAVMGSYGLRPLQVAISAIKTPLLLLGTFALGLPCMAVLYAVMGLRDEFPRAVRALVAAQGGITMALVSLAPLTILWYVSTDGYLGAIGFNGAMFALACTGGAFSLGRSARQLIARDPRHRGPLRAWVALYIFIGIQMAWVLRPFIGDPARPVVLFRAEAWGNAYEAAFAVARGALLGG